MKKLVFVFLIIASLITSGWAQSRTSSSRTKRKVGDRTARNRGTTTNIPAPLQKTAAELADLQPGDVGREYWQTDGTGGLYRDYGRDIGIQRVSACISPYDIKLIPNDNQPPTRAANSAAWEKWMAGLSIKGACIQFPEGEFYFETTLTFRRPIKLLGAGTQYVAGAPPTGTALIVESGQNGITVARDSKNSLIQGVLLRTRTGNSVRTGDGIHAEGIVRIEQVVIESFGRDGIYFDGTPPTITDFSSVSDSHAWYVGRDGLHLDGGSDTNVIHVINFNATNSGRHGVYNAGASNVFSNLHVAYAGLVEKGSAAYFDNGSSNIYLNPYSEDGEPFYLGPDSNYNTIICGMFGVPRFDPNAPGLYAGHNILERGAHRGLRFRDISDSASGHQYSLQAANYSYPGEIRLHNDTTNQDVFSYDPGKSTLRVPSLTATAAKIGSNGAALSYATHGTATLSGGTVTVPNTNITANSRVLVTRTSKGSGVLSVSAKTTSLSFTVSSSDGNDNGTFDYWIVN